jgi:sialidase-1
MITTVDVLFALLSSAISGGPQVDPSRPGEEVLEKRDLFEAGQGGYTMYRIPGLVVTTKGTLLAYCEARKGAGLDWDSIDILLRRSEDGGKEWSAPVKVAQVEGPIPKNPASLARNVGATGTVTYNNAVAIVDSQPGVVHFIFCLEYMRCFYQRSDDDGKTFGRPVEITSTLEHFRKAYDWKAFGVGPAHGIQLRNGRLLAPIWLSRGTGNNAHHPSVVTTLYSDDHGSSWRGGEIAADEKDPLVDPGETVALELEDGRIMINMRNDSEKHRRAVAFSPDGATHWTRPAFDEQLLETICMGSLCRLTRKGSGDRSRVLFANPHNPDCAAGGLAAGRQLKRKNLTVKLSYDEGKTWSLERSLESGISAYSDLAVGPDGTIYCLYERETIDGSIFHTKYLTLARFNLEWLSQGKDALGPGAKIGSGK